MWGELIRQGEAWEREASAEPTDKLGYRWVAEHPMLTREARALDERVRARLAAREVPGVFEMDVEAAMYTLAMRVWERDDKDLPRRVLWHWIERVGVEEATRTLLHARTQRVYGDDMDLRGTCPLFFQVSKEPSRPLRARELGALREVVRAFGVVQIEPVLRAAFVPTTPSEEAALAWLVDDVGAARDLYAKVTAEGSALRALSILVGLFDDAEAACGVASDLAVPAPEVLQMMQTHGKDYALKLNAWRFADPSPEGGAFVRAALRHGLRFASTALACASLHPPSWAPVLACFPSLRAARLLVSMVDKKPQRKLVGQGLANMPREAKAALREAQADRPKHLDAIEALLATLPDG
jgi:hypothetical protein